MSDSEKSIEEEIEALRSDFFNALNQAMSLKDFEQIKLKFLSKKGPVQALMKILGSVSAEKRPIMGQKINQFREELTSALEKALREAEERALDEKLKSETLDISVPGSGPEVGSTHPVLNTLDKILDCLIHLGFTIHYGPNVDTDFYNFEALNFPPDHPARDMQDTFYLSHDYVLRTQTSNAQIHQMEEQKPPIRVAIPGKCFRNETVTARSHIMFHQVEGLYIDKEVSMGDLLATLERFFELLFETKISLRIRPSYFPFVEPGVEVDVSCLFCQSKGCSLCKQTGWLEVAGAGMVHPNVLRSGGIDPELYSGFAWGMGVERLVLLLNRIPDIRLFTENRVDFLSQMA